MWDNNDTVGTYVSHIGFYRVVNVTGSSAFPSYSSKRLPAYTVYDEQGGNLICLDGNGQLYFIVNKYVQSEEVKVVKTIFFETDIIEFCGSRVQFIQ